jgi:DNA polymerase III subunit delta'
MKFSEIVGQNRVKNLLVQTVRKNRVSHAQLFTGPEGCGKLALAIAFAQFVSCENKQYFEEGSLRGDSCGICPSCVKYAKLAHPDLHFFMPVASTKEVKKPMSRDFVNEFRNLLLQSNFMAGLQEWHDKIGIENKQGIINAEDCNEMSKVLTYKAYESEYKVVIIWHAERLYHAAAPKILKILEEPPDKTLFILITGNTDMVLNTILSRTQILKVPRFNAPDVVQYLRSRFELSDAAANKIALLSEGNLRMAIRLVEDHQDEAENFSILRDWFRLCYSNDILKIVPLIEGVAKLGRERQKSLLLYALRVFRRCQLFHYRLDALVKLEGEELEFVQKVSPFIHPSNIAEFNEMFNKAAYHIERNANPRILFMNLSIRVNKLMKNTA